MIRAPSVIVALAWLLSGVSAAAAPGDAPADASDPLFESRERLQIHLSAPFRALSRDRSDEPEYRPGRLTFSGTDGAERVFDIKVRPRGRSRRDKEVCTFPPLRLNFRKSELKGTLFDGQDKLKLVTHCRRSPRHLRFVYREYLVYRLLNQLTEASFRVRPLDVTYTSSEGNGRPLERFGFFIEDKEPVARRLGLKTVDIPGSGIEPGELDPEHTALMELFQFMIGNTDFSFMAGNPEDDCCHNAVLMATAEGRYAPIPYDFDITGIVNPPYAVVDYRLPLHSVRQRLYRGFCRDVQTMSRAMERFREARGAMFQVIATETELDERDRAGMREYVEEFFAIIDDPDARARNIDEDCRD